MDPDSRVEPVYVSPNKKIKFFPNRADGPKAYDVFFGDKDRLYIRKGTLDDLTSPDVTPDRMLQKLNNMNNETATFVLARQDIAPRDFYVHLLHLRIAETERERDHFFGLYSDSSL